MKTSANKRRNRICIGIIILTALICSCNSEKNAHEKMLSILKQKQDQYNRLDNYYAPDAHVRYFDSLINASFSAQDKMRYTYDKARALIALGREDEAIIILEQEVEKIREQRIQGMDRMNVLLALAHLRSGERMNCINNHTPETCILPIQGTGIHKIQTGSQLAVQAYEALLRDHPDNLEYRWLLNIAYMTLGKYPGGVPAEMLVPDLDHNVLDEHVKPFQDVATQLSLDVNNMAGGCIIDDFDNDDYLDLVTSAWGVDDEMHYFKNNGDGTFTDRSEASQLKQLTGGLNIMQMDYNNDGFKDIFVLRGAWLRGNYGQQPNSLLKNNGDGTFTDVTTASGLLTFHPTQTATWNDFNNDGWIDVFIGNESWEGNASSGMHPAELFVSNKDGTFTNVAQQSGVAVTGFVKGVTSGDYNNDGWKDIFITSLSGQRYLFRNKGIQGLTPLFEDVTKQAGIAEGTARTFPTWFWDYNNDGWLDIFAGDFTFDRPIASYSAAEAMNIPTGSSGACILYRNNTDGTFTNVSEAVGLTRKAFAMGANFGDIDNDGFLDIYLGTGNPELESIVPNKLFKNIRGEMFIDVTASAKVGHLQKGHGVSFADADNDGDQDIYIEMGGAYKGDSFHNAFYLNPNQDEKNHWISLNLIGTKTNRAAIGARVKISITEGKEKRTIYRDVNSGGSFGASPLRKEIGIGRAEIIDELVIDWGSGSTQRFHNVKADRFIRIHEGSDVVEELTLRRLDFLTNHVNHHVHH